MGTDNSAVRIYDESNHRLLSSWIALYDEHTHSHPSSHHPRATSTSPRTPSKFVLDWNQQLCRIYASSTDSDHISLWDVERERCLYTVDAGSSGGVHCLTSDANGYCAAGMADGTVRCFDTRSKEEAVLVIAATSPANRQSPIITLKRDTGSNLLSIDSMGQLRRWYKETGHSAELSFSQTSQNVLAADVHPIGHVLALATTNALQFKTNFGDLLSDIKNSKFAQVSCLSFHPYRSLLAIGFQDGSLSMFTGKTNASTG